MNKEELYFCSYRYRRTVRNKGSPHLVTFNCSDLKIKTERMLAIKEEQHSIKMSHRRGALGEKNVVNGKSSSSSTNQRASAKRTHSEAVLDVPPLLGLQRRASVQFLDDVGGEYTYTVYGGSSFKEDGTIIRKKEKKSRVTLGGKKKEHQFSGNYKKEQQKEVFLQNEFKNIILILLRN